MPDAPRLRIAREGAVAVLWIEAPPRVRRAHRRRECDLLAPGSGPRMDAESRRDREALEDRWPLEGARDPRERKRRESARCPSTGDREPPRLSGRRVRSGEGPRDRVRLEATLCGEGDQAHAHGGRREALPQPLPPRVATRDPAPLDGRAQSGDGTAPREAALR